MFPAVFFREAIMKSFAKKPFKWHVIIGGLIIAGLLILLIGGIVGIWLEATFAILTKLGLAVLLLALLAAVYAAVRMTHENIRAIQDNAEGIDGLSEMMNKNREILNQINIGVRLSEKAKSIVFRDIDIQALREAVLEKLHQEDYDSTYQMINAVAKEDEFREVGEQLLNTADKYHNSDEEERINQVVAHIEKLFEQHQWTKAAMQIDRLRKTFPHSSRVNALGKHLLQKKDHRKRELLAAWDDAVKRKENERSLAILKELDLYLTPSEGLALQESARDVFRTKLHNLGVQFSLAIADNEWQQALQAGEQIVREFPNSRMSSEIREKMSILRERAKEQPQKNSEQQDTSDEATDGSA